MRHWYGVAVGGLGWSPRIFWKATVAEFFLAIAGHNETQRSGPPPLTRAELEELEERYINNRS